MSRSPIPLEPALSNELYFMQLNKERIKEFQKIYRQEFNEKIDENESREKAGRLLELIKIIYQNHESRKRNK